MPGDIQELEIPVWADGEIEVTGFIHQFMAGYYSTVYDPSFGEGFRHLVKINDKRYIIDMQELLTGNRSQQLIRQTTQKATAAVVVFSVNRAGSLDAAKDLVSEIKRVRRDNGFDDTPVALVGNRTAGERRVTVEEIDGLRRFESYDIVAECCASGNDAAVIQKIFLDLVSIALSRPGKDDAKQGQVPPKHEEHGPQQDVPVKQRRKTLAHRLKSIFKSRPESHA